MKETPRNVINRVKQVLEKMAIGCSGEEEGEDHLRVFSDLKYKLDPGIIARVYVDIDKDSQYLRTQIVFKEPVPNEFVSQVDELIVRLNFHAGMGHGIRYPGINRFSFLYNILLGDFRFDDIEFEKVIHEIHGKAREMYKAVRGLIEDQVPVETLIQDFKGKIKDN